MTRIVPTLTLLMTLAVAASAGEVLHEVAAGESLERISRRYYGDTSRAEMLWQHNELDRTGVHVGSKLRIPLADVHEVVKDDTWSALAKHYWGDASLHRELAKLASADASLTLRPGQSLRIPVLIRYSIQAGDNLTSLSRRFYGHPLRAETLVRINRIKNPKRLLVGQVLRIPLLQLASSDAIRLQARSTPKAAPKEKAAAPPPPPVSAAPPPRHFEAPLRSAINAYLEGDFEGALKQLESLRPQVMAHGEPSARISLLRRLTFAYVAFDRVEDVCATYAALRSIEPHPKWDPDQVSPKIRELLAACDGG